MVSRLKPLDLIATAQRLVLVRRSKRPKQSDLKRAVSTVYYALFHAMCRNCADCFIGGNAADRSNPAWRQAYRAIDHKFAKSQCQNRSVLAKFPKDVEDFANLFHELQIDRHAADYDPHATFTQTEVVASIKAAELAIQAFQRVPIKHKRAFAAWVAIKDRKD